MIEIQSGDISELAKALNRAQATLGHALKDATNPHFNSRFATLESVIDVVKPAFAENGLSFTQTTIRDEFGVSLVTTMLHESGQWMRGVLPVINEKNTAQSLGSGISYSRRYALSAIAGIAQIDDDANEATAKPDHQPPASKPVTPIKPKITPSKPLAPIAAEVRTPPDHARLGDPWEVRIPASWKNSGGASLRELGLDGTLKLSGWLSSLEQRSATHEMLYAACREALSQNTKKKDSTAASDNEFSEAINGPQTKAAK